jgi:hypothetical protein
MVKPKQVTATRLFNIATVIGNRHLIQLTVDAEHNPVILSLEQLPDYRIETDHGSFAKKQADRENAFRIHHHITGQWQLFDLPLTAENLHFVQPLGGKWLLVRGRAGKEDRNAHVYGPNGKAKSFHAGDGIEDVQVTDKDHIWISYFDEGVFGDTILGTSGLASLTQSGRPVFRFTELSSDRIVQSMADCYALNVCSDKEVWLYYYTDFPLVRLINRKMDGHWMLPVSGSHGFAVDGERVLFGGSYNKRDALFLGVLASVKTQPLTPVDEGGNRLKQFRAFGRGRLLYMQTEEALFVMDLDTL